MPPGPERRENNRLRMADCGAQMLWSAFFDIFPRKPELSEKRTKCTYIDRIC